MSVGRDLCKRLIDVAEDMRDYAALVEQFESTPDTRFIVAEALIYARALESLIPRVLGFEGETMPALGPAEVLA